MLVISKGQTIKKSWGKLLSAADFREEAYCTAEIPKEIVEFEDGQMSCKQMGVKD